MNSVGPETTTLEIHNRDQAEAAGAQIAALTILLNAAVAKQNRATFAAQKHAAAAQALQERMVRYEEALKTWAQANRAEMGEKKSLEMRHVTIAFKLSNPAVNLLENWEPRTVVAKLWKSRKFRKWVRVKYELDRQRILSDSRQLLGKVTAKLLQRFGLEITQEEKFYVEPKLATTAP